MFYWLFKWTLGLTLRVIFRPKVEGVENVPDHGGAIIASNHLSFSDSFFAPLVVPRRKVTFMAKAEYFTTGGVKGAISRWFFRGAGQLSVDRSGGKASANDLNSGLGVLQAGELLGIYPEGTRSPDGKLYKGRTGVARLALEAGVPVVPCAMLGTDRLQPPGQVVPKLMRPGVRFGKALDFSRYAGMESDRLVLRAITDEIMYELMRMSGQDYVDIYATKAKELLKQSAAKTGKTGRAANTGSPATDGATPLSIKDKEAAIASAMAAQAAQDVQAGHAGKAGKRAAVTADAGEGEAVAPAAVAQLAAGVVAQQQALAKHADDPVDAEPASAPNDAEPASALIDEPGSTAAAGTDIGAHHDESDGDASDR